MDIKIFKTCVIIPFSFEEKKFDEIILNNDFFEERPVDINTNNGVWINNEAQHLFDVSSKECFIRRYDVKITGMKLLKYKQANECILRKFDYNKPNFYIKKYKDIRFSIDNIQLWIMRTGNGFATYEITVTDTYNNKKDQPISDEMCYRLIYELKRTNEFFHDQNICKDNEYKKVKFTFNCRHFVKEILEKNSFKDYEIGKTKTLSLNYVVTDDIKSDEANYFLYNIDKDLNLSKYECSDKKSIDENKVYYNKEFYEEYKNKWLATPTSITMLGDATNSKLTKTSGIMQSVFDRHLFLMLYYENLSMLCDKVERKCTNAGVIETIYTGEFKNCFDWLVELLKNEDVKRKNDYLNKIKKEDENNYFRYLFDNELNHIGGIAYDVDGRSEQLNMVYAYYFALKNKNYINSRIGRIIEKHDNTKIAVKERVVKYAKIGLKVARLAFPFIKDDNSSNNNEKCS